MQHRDALSSCVQHSASCGLGAGFVEEERKKHLTRLRVAFASRSAQTNTNNEKRVLL